MGLSGGDTIMLTLDFIVIILVILGLTSMLGEDHEDLTEDVEMLQEQLDKLQKSISSINATTNGTIEPLSPANNSKPTGV